MFHTSEAERPGFPELPFQIFVDLGVVVVVPVLDQGFACLLDNDGFNTSERDGLDGPGKVIQSGLQVRAHAVLYLSWAVVHSVCWMSSRKPRNTGWKMEPDSLKA